MRPILLNTDPMILYYLLLGVGKTTLVRNVCDLLQERHGVIVRGFYTEEVRVAGGGGGGARGRGRGPRIGFDVVTLDGKRAPLARADRYDVGVASESNCNGMF